VHTGGSPRFAPGAAGELRAAQGKPDETRVSCRTALAIIDGVAAGLADAALRDIFLASAHVRHVRR
jgi:hypothetical protein